MHKVRKLDCMTAACMYARERRSFAVSREGIQYRNSKGYFLFIIPYHPAVLLGSWYIVQYRLSGITKRLFGNIVKSFIFVYLS